MQNVVIHRRHFWTTVNSRSEFEAMHLNFFSDIKVPNMLNTEAIKQIRDNNELFDDTTGFRRCMRCDSMKCV